MIFLFFPRTSASNIYFTMKTLFLVSLLPTTHEASDDGNTGRFRGSKIVVVCQALLYYQSHENADQLPSLVKSNTILMWVNRFYFSSFTERIIFTVKNVPFLIRSLSFLSHHRWGYQHLLLEDKWQIYCFIQENVEIKQTLKAEWFWTFCNHQWVLSLWNMHMDY